MVRVISLLWLRASGSSTPPTVGARRDSGKGQQRLLRHGVRRGAGRHQQGVARLERCVLQGEGDLRRQDGAEGHVPPARGDVRTAQAERRRQLGLEVGDRHGVRLADIDVDDARGPGLREEPAHGGAAGAQGGGDLGLGGVLEVVQPGGPVEELGGEAAAAASSPRPDRCRLEGIGPSRREWTPRVGVEHLHYAGRKWLNRSPRHLFSTSTVVGVRYDEARRSARTDGGLCDGHQPDHDARSPDAEQFPTRCRPSSATGRRTTGSRRCRCRSAARARCSSGSRRSGSARAT